MFLVEDHSSHIITNEWIQVFFKATAMHIKFEYIFSSNKNENACILLLSDAYSCAILFFYLKENMIFQSYKAKTGIRILC